MPSVLAYLRPRSLDEASALLAGPNRKAIGGGTIVVPDARVQRDDGVELVDLQGLGLDQLTVEAGQMHVGAMVRLGDMVGDDRVPQLLRELARHELPSALRNQATVGGTIAVAESESVLLAGLLVHDATVHCHGTDSTPLADFLVQGVGDRLITSVSCDTAGRGAWAATGRTPMDTPIVAVVGRHTEADVHTAITGVGPTPVLVDHRAPESDLDPPSDFRGSARYRSHLATVLSRRVIEELMQ